MSVEAAREFHSRVLEDSALSKRLLDEVYSTGDAPNWSEHGKLAGLDFTNEEAQGYMDQLDDEYELTEFELELVAAAVPPSCSDQGA